jgi:hypothetical protein
MSSRMKPSIRYWAAGAGVLSLAVAAPLLAHHSFASYDMNRTMVLTGVVSRVNPDANHLQIFFGEMTDDRKTVKKDKDGNWVIWAVDMAGSAQSAQEGVSVNSFPRGTVFSVALHPQRNGETAGFREGPIFKCPMNDAGKGVPPAPGKHCDSVQGFSRVGQGDLPKPGVSAAPAATK